MKRREGACEIWLEICEKCERGEEEFAGAYTGVWENTLEFIEKIDNQIDKFSLAILAKDNKAIQTLYDSIRLNEYQEHYIKKLLKRNNELFLTLNPFVLDTKYDFLNPVIDELVIDIFIQDKLLSLDDYELSVLKRITEYCINYGINPNKILSNIINNIGRSVMPGRNEEFFLEKFNLFFKLLHNYETNGGIIDNKMLNNIIFIFKTGIIPDTIDELINYNEEIKNILIEKVNKTDVSVKEIKQCLFLTIFAMTPMDIYNAGFFVRAFNIDSLNKEYYTEAGIIELLTLRMMLETNDIEKLKLIANEIINNFDFKVNLFNNILIEENLLLFYAREFNKCKPNFNENNFIEEKEKIRFYDSGIDFYAIVKVLGAFSDDGKGICNYFDEWNNERCRSHINAVSLIRNDNLAFAEVDGKYHVKVGFLEFDEKMFLGGGNKDIGTTASSRQMSSIIFSKLFLPEEFINNTRQWHNELDYERKNLDKVSKTFKKNPDFIVLDQEVEDVSVLPYEEQVQYNKIFEESIKASRDFGNIPILVINREKIAKNEKDIIRKMLDDYNFTHDIKLLKSLVIRFNNNRNGCRGPQHQYIRENYFSNEYFKEILSEINDNILEEHREEIENLLLSESKKNEYLFI